MIPFDQFKAAADAIPYQYRHPHFLYALVKWLRPRSVVEVGTHLGMSAVWMARGLQENGLREIDGRRVMLTCIDNFCWRDQPTQRQQWEENIDRCGVREWVTLTVGRSQEVEWPARVDFAYIDGNHSSIACTSDVRDAAGFGARCVCLNDISTCAGVQKTADWMRGTWDGWGFIEVPFDAGLLVALKREPLPAPTQGDYDPWDVDEEQRKMDWQPPPNSTND